MRRRQTDYLELASVADQNEYYPTQQYLYLDDHSRKYALIGVIVSLAYSFTLCVLGSIVFPFGEMLSIKCTELSKTMIKLGLNISATLCAYVTGSVHATTLKWALIGDGRPGFNTNLRFFTATGGLFSVTGRITNFLYLVLSITSQASVTLVFYPISPENDSKISNILFNKPGELRVSSLALFIFGLALTCQSLLGLWAYFSVNISTWSSNPLDVAIAAYISGNIERCENRCLRPAAHMKDSGVKSIKPSSRQPSLCESDTLIGYIIVITWSGVAASGIWLTIALLLVSKLTCTSWISHSPNPLSACNLSALNPFVPTACIATTYRRSDVSPNSSLAENLCIAIVIQGYFAVVLHCGELVAALSRDEDIWRGASIHGALHTGNQLKNFWSWKMILFIVLDPFLHWILGNTVVFTQEQTGSRPMQVYPYSYTRKCIY